MARILIVDDEKDVHYSFRRMLKRETDLEVVSAHSGEEALSFLEHGMPIDVAVMDIRMGGMSGLEALRRMAKFEPRQRPIVIIMTAFSTADVAIEATKLGAYDYVIKPFDVEKMKALVHEALRARYAMQRVVTLEAEGDLEDVEADRIVGRHPSMQAIYKMIGRVAPTEASVLIQGESGTGKELVARAIYHHSARNEKIFLPINCAAIPEALLESELFGHERGAFTGAVERRLGKFEQCEGGTLFLDEIGDFSPALQGKILRVIEDHSFQRVGGDRWITSDVRILAATHQNLAEMVRAGRFREDLLYRLNVVSITIPPLRERADDVPALIRFFLRKYGPQYGGEHKSVGEEAMAMLGRYHWPGNVRQLENAVKRAIVISRGDLILPEDFHLPEETSADRETAGPDTAADKREDLSAALGDVFQGLCRTELPKGMLPYIERELVRRAIEYTNGNQVQAAKLLGLSRNTLRARLEELGLLSKEKP